MAERLRSFGRSSLSFLVLLAVWWLLTALRVVPKAYLPTPPMVWTAFVHGLQDGTLVANMSVSLVRLIVSYTGASLMGIAVGVLMGLIPMAGRILRQPLTFFSSLSGITWLPLAIAWFGVSNITVAFVVFNSVFFIMAINTLMGVQSVPKVYEQALLTMGAGRWRVVAQVLIPGAMPSVLTGLRLGMGFGWRALIAVEMAAGASGMGYLVFNASYNFHQDVLLMGILVTGFIALLIDQVFLQPLERRTIERWGMV